MRFKLMFVAALMLAVAGLTGCQQQAGPKIVLVDPAEVFQSCDACVKGGDYLRGMGQKMQQSLAKIQQPAEGEMDTEALKKAQGEFMAMQQQMNEEQQRIVEKLNTEFQAVMDEYRTTNNVSVIINKKQALSFDGAADITKAVVEAMNARQIDLGIEETAAETSAEPSAEPSAEMKAPEAEEGE